MCEKFFFVNFHKRLRRVRNMVPI